MNSANSHGLPLSVLVPAGTSSQLVLGIGVDGKSVVAVGGQGHDLFYGGSGDALSEKSSPGPGLRGCFVRGDEIWVAGEYRYIAHSPDRGESWNSLNGPRRSGCLFNVIEDSAGHIWAAGDGGWIARAKDGSTFVEVSGISEKIARITHSKFGIIAPTDEGSIYILSGSEVRKTSLEAETELMKATVTPRGTIVVVGREGVVYRSTDEGSTFTRIDVDTDTLLTAVDHLPDGRVIAVGLGGVIRISSDDAASFEAFPHELGMTDLWCTQPQFDTMLVGGEQGQLLRLGSYEKPLISSGPIPY